MREGEEAGGVWREDGNDVWWWLMVVCWWLLVLVVVEVVCVGEDGREEEMHGERERECHRLPCLLLSSLPLPS